MQTREIKEALPGGWHTVRRVFFPGNAVARLTCPACQNSDDEKFQTVVEGTCLKGFLCMNCTRG